jgi:UPF0176 protein
MTRSSFSASSPACSPALTSDAAVSVAAFYRFVRIDDPAQLKHRLAAQACRLAIKGTILVAPEGINGTIAGDSAALDTFFADLTADERFTGLEVKRSVASESPFGRLKVKIKREIVTFGASEAGIAVDPARLSGHRVPPERWNALIAEPDVTLIDTRNAYEVAIGTFRGAIDPGTRSFTAFRDFVARDLDPTRHRRIAMFCTGGIRCEKASAYLLALGFPEVHQLDGGILRYLAEVPPSESAWTGACYVFDERVSVVEGVVEGPHDICRACGAPVPVGRVCGCGRSTESMGSTGSNTGD